VFDCLRDYLETGMLACQEGAFVVCFLFHVPMVPSSTLADATDGEHLTCGGFSLGKTIRIISKFCQQIVMVIYFIHESIIKNLNDFKK
jgi:hypothetical protein